MSKLRNSHIKNIIVIFLLVFSSTNCYSCKKENTIANNPKAVEISNDYTEIPISKKKIKEDDKSIIYELKTNKNEIFLLVLDVEKENATLEINNQQILTDFNFTYDISEADAIREIKILVNPNGNIIFLLPVATEEFLTFQILKFDKARNKFFESNFFFETHDNIHDLYLKSKANLSETNNEYRLKIGSFEFKGSFEKKDTVTAEYNLLLDLNFDGVKEEFLVDFHQNTINSSKSIDKNIFFEANNVLIIQKVVSHKLCK